ncbi:MAG: DUF1150 domain-containing protein [Sagittula sp.]|jgi:hypothetical protein|uniref:DUF1150 domain-containing protein n=1 Tax=unclassified Sagittula TaxID=2624628 RepID=UPI0024C2769B|nr:DUF1150 domain-containing protein [Sagittula sp. MA-2]WHZ35603.1 DUF1150 domain-containing protein [Sagittula sp. MA-2]
MHTKYDISKLMDEGRTVYVRPVQRDELPEEMQDQMDGRETIYAVHRADGERLALVKNRSLAFALARQNDLAPVTVH